MPEPTSTASITAAAAVAGAIPAGIIVIFGVSLGLRVDVLVAGFSGALCALALLPNGEAAAAPADNLFDFVRAGLQRLMRSLASSLVAGYTAMPATHLIGAPFPSALDFVAGPGTLAMACIIGAGSQTLLPLTIDRLARIVGESKPPAKE